MASISEVVSKTLCTRARGGNCEVEHARPAGACSGNFRKSMSVHQENEQPECARPWKAARSSDLEDTEVGSGTDPLRRRPDRQLAVSGMPWYENG